MKHIYFCQFNDTDPDNAGYYYFPYSVGLLWANAKQNSIISNQYCLGDFFFIKQDFKKIIDSMQNPDILCVSSYIWNEQYNLELTRLVKKNYPNCKIVYGGPSSSSCTKEWANKYPWIDYVVYGEGENIFTELLLCIEEKKSVKNILSIGYWCNNDFIVNKKQQRIENLDTIPSPYTLGLFNSIVKKYQNNPNVTLNGIIETNRGCPYACTFCDWGGVTLSKIKRRNIDCIKKEILWMAENCVELLLMADANYLIFQKRDEEILDFVIECKQKYGYPKLVDFGGWSKNQTVDSVDVAKKLYDNGLLRRFNISIQTNNENSLKAMKRTNSPHIQEILARAIDLNIPVSMDLIFGSPYDTYNNVINLLANGYEQNLHYYGTPFMILTGSEASLPEYQERYGIQTKTIRSKNSYLVDEHQTFITATSTMTEQEYQKLLVWFWFSQLLEGGYTNLIRQASNKAGMTTQEFYNKIINFISNTNLLRDYYNTKVYQSQQFNFDKFEPYPNAKEFIELIETNKHEFFTEIEIFCNSLKLEVSVQDIVKIQKHIKSRPKHNPIIDFESNIYEYLKGDALEINAHRYEFDYSVARDWFSFRKNGTYFFFWLSTRANQLWQSKVIRLS